MKILIDGDGCPVVDLTVKAGKENSLETLIFCDTAHIINKEGVKTITVEKGADSVDFALLKYVERNDIVVTQDYGLASMVLSKGGIPIKQDGLIFTFDNIDLLLAERHENKKLRKSKSKVKGPKKRKEEDDISFLFSLNSLMKSTK